MKEVVCGCCEPDELRRDIYLHRPRQILPNLDVTSVHCSGKDYLSFFRCSLSFSCITTWHGGATQTAQRSQTLTGERCEKQQSDIEDRRLSLSYFEEPFLTHYKRDPKLLQHPHQQMGIVASHRSPSNSSPSKFLLKPPSPVPFTAMLI